MKKFFALKGNGTAKLVAVGLAAGLVNGLLGAGGGILASFAYPVYNAIVKAKRKKLAPEIIRLADELMK